MTPRTVKLEFDRQEGSGLLTRDEGRLPPSVRTLLEKGVKDEKITSVTAWRYPLMKNLQNIIKKFITLPYDSVYHLGLNLSGYNLEKDVVIKFTKGSSRNDTPENKSDVYPVTKDITFGQLFDQLASKMGKNFTSYDAFENNCQDFSLAILSVLGVGDDKLKTFIKQDAQKILKSAGVLSGALEVGAKLSALKDQVVDRLTQGEGHQPPQLYNFQLPYCKIQV